MTHDFFHLPIAQSALTFLIYLILGIFWLVGNIAQQKKAKARAEDLKRRKEEREREEARTGKKSPKPHPLERDLETLLGRMSGESVQAPQEESSPPPLPPPSSKPKEERIKEAFEVDMGPPLQYEQPVATPKKLPKTNIGGMDLADSYKEMKDIEDALEMSYEQMEGELSSQTLDTVRQVMVDLSPTMIDFARMPVQRMRTVDATTKPPALKNRKAFKKAVLGGVILGPPVALQDPNSHEK